MKDRLSSLARIAVLLVLAFALTGALGACASSGEGAGAEPEAKTPVLLASTTSTEDSGLFDVIEPAFEKAYPQYDLQITAVGTGQALELGKNKDADVLLVHAKADEEAFVADGYGTQRTDVMYNDFVIVGPASDPAGIKGSSDALAALKKIAATESTFISRGDDSGTHKKELKVWKAASVEPTAAGGEWYLSIGQGMGEALKVAGEKQGYTLADRATWLALKANLQLDLVVEGDKNLFNQYGVIPVSDASHAEGAQAFADWIVSDETQALVGDFGVEKYGQSLFVPNAP